VKHFFKILTDQHPSLCKRRIQKKPGFAADMNMIFIIYAIVVSLSQLYIYAILYFYPNLDKTWIYPNLDKNYCIFIQTYLCYAVFLSDLVRIIKKNLIIYRDQRC
jgi:hypothetical protein